MVHISKEKNIAEDKRGAGKRFYRKGALVPRSHSCNYTPRERSDGSRDVIEVKRSSGRTPEASHGFGWFCFMD